MKTDTSATPTTPTINPDFDKALADAKARPELPKSQEFLADQCDWKGSEVRLNRELQAQIEANAPIALQVSPRTIAENWRYACYVAERESIDLDAAVAHLMELGAAADSSQNRLKLYSTKA